MSESYLTHYQEAQYDSQDLDIGTYTHCVPWWKGDYFQGEDDDTLIAYHKEILDFVNWLSPIPEETIMRSDVFERIDKIVKELWPDARVEIFGSYSTNLSIPTSDMDLVIYGTNQYMDGVSALFNLASALENKGICFQANVITTAKVPIIKLKDNKSSCYVDITLDGSSGPENTKIIKGFLVQYPLLRPLTLVIKFYLKQRYLNDTWSGGIGSYTLVLMIISFLQLHTKHKGKDSEDNMAALLIRFFELYGKTFDYFNDAISLLEEGKYFPKKTRSWENEHNPELLSIEDPYDPAIDVGSSTFGIQKAKKAFEEGYEKLYTFSQKKEKKSFLSQIIYDQDVSTFRNRVVAIYGEKFRPSHFTSKKNRACSTFQRNTNSKPNPNLNININRRNNQKKINFKTNNNNNNGQAKKNNNSKKNLELDDKNNFPYLPHSQEKLYEASHSVLNYSELSYSSYAQLS